MAAQTNKSIAPVKVVTATTVTGGLVSNHNTDTPTGTIQLIAGAAEGSRITKLFVNVRDTVTACRVLLFKSTDGGTTKRCIGSKALSAYTWSTTADFTPVDFGYSDANPLLLDSANDILYVGLTVAQATACVVIEVQGGEYA